MELLSHEILNLLLQSDELEFRDLACGQNPTIQQDINKWNKNELTVMEKKI
ncbi:hypothetical protein C1645_840410 [Glomus cerebriforme]|uniref:Uncharacterized protein n=1 Tax=Glomus cerebriforme TaxID=658196 RepID=A0A397S4B2_9GLOM|nr:hypothetical protein C1645_840410 [Glomus cerebriforme]